MAKTKRIVTWLLPIVFIGFIIIAYISYRGVDKKPTKVAGLSIPKAVWELLEEEQERMSNLQDEKVKKILRLDEGNKWIEFIKKQVRNKPTVGQMIMLAQAYESNYMKAEALRWYLRAAEVSPDAMIGIGKLCYDAAIPNMARQTEKGLIFMQPDERAVEILTCARNFIVRGRMLRSRYKEKAGEIPIYLFRPDKENRLLWDIESLLMRYWFGKGKEFRKAKEYKQALVCLDNGLSIDNNDPGLNVEKGQTLFELGRYEEALRYAEKAIQLDPNWAVALNNYGICRLAAHGLFWPLKGNREAIDFLKNELDSHRREIRLAAFILLWSVAERKDEYAKTILEEAKRNSPKLANEFEQLNFDTRAPLAPPPRRSEY